MPNLPTVAATAAQNQRITAAFGSVDNYKAWLREEIKRYVFAHEARQIQAQADADIQAKRADVDTNFGTLT